MASQFDYAGRYYACIESDGILKIWNTSTNTLENEYVPDIHLASPCTCLQFVGSLQNSKNKSPNKRKKADSISSEIVIGTTSGKLLKYSILKGDIKCTIDGNLNSPVSCLSNNVGEIIYSGNDKNVVVWNIVQRKFMREWKAGTDNITAILAIPNSEKLLTASKSITLWNTDNDTILKVFTGHMYTVNFLSYIPHSHNYSVTKYIISASRGDRLLNCWNIEDDVEGVEATASLLAEDDVLSISALATVDGSTKVAVVFETGGLNVFEVVLNGKCRKPIKPKNTIKFMAETDLKEHTGRIDDRIFISSSQFRNENTVLIAHGIPLVLTFEEVELGSKPMVVLVRRHPHMKKESCVNTDKVITPIAGKSATYITPYSKVLPLKRTAHGEPKRQLPTLGEIVANLSSNTDYSEVPRSNNMSKLLIQGLKSKDMTIIHQVFRQEDEATITNTLESLDYKYLPEVLNIITDLARDHHSYIQRPAILWYGAMPKVHMTWFMTHPDVPEILEPLHRGNKYHTAHNKEICELINFLKDRRTRRAAQYKNEEETTDDSVFIFNDIDSDSEDEVATSSDEESLSECSEEKMEVDNGEEDSDSDQDLDSIDGDNVVENGDDYDESSD